MRKESSTVQKCKRQMATLGFDSQLAYHRVKLILKIYRDVVWVLSERVEELHEYAWELGAQDADTGLSNGQRPFFLVVLKGRTLERFLAMFPLIQCLIQKALNQCLLGEGRMSIQVGLQPLKHVI